MFKRIEVTDWISAVTLVFLILTFFRDCSQDKKINDIAYYENALRYRPLLTIAAKPNILSFRLNSGPINIKQLQRDSLFNDSLSSAVDLPSTLSLKTVFRVTNSGNSLAKIYVIIWGDTVSGVAKFRDILANNKARDRVAWALVGKDYFETKEVPPGDTVDIDVEQTIQFEKDSCFTMHDLFIYEGENGVLYDTYYWAKYKANPIYIKPLFGEINGKPFVRFVYFKDQFRNFLTLQSQNTSWKTYSKGESSNILGFLKQLKQKEKGDSKHKPD